MDKICGYIKTMIQYLHTPKGKFDFFEDIKAIVIIAATIAFVFAVLEYFK